MADRHVVIDPYVLAVPSDPGDAAGYVGGLITWLPVLSARRDESSCFQAALEVLLREERFPTHANLSPLLARAGTLEYSIVDILQMVSVIAATEPFFETFIERRAAAATNILVTPAETLTRLGTDLGKATGDSFVLAAVAQESGWCPESTYLATSSWEDEKDWIEASADVSLVERLDGDLESLNRPVNGLVRVLTETGEIEFSDSLTDVYQTPATAVASVLYQMRRYDSTLPGAVEVTAGVGFVASIEAQGIQHQPAILETLFHRAVLAALGRLSQIRGAKLHPVRTSKAADAPQVERADGAKLWRCMVTKTGAGYRLHYWMLVGGGIELVEVMQENAV